MGVSISQKPSASKKSRVTFAILCRRKIFFCTWALRRSRYLNRNLSASSISAPSSSSRENGGVLAVLKILSE